MRLTVAEVRERLRIGRTTLWRLVCAKKIAAIRASTNRLVFDLAEVERYERAHTEGGRT